MKSAAIDSGKREVINRGGKGKGSSISIRNGKKGLD